MSSTRACSPATRCSRVGPVRPVAPSRTATRSWTRSGPASSRSRRRPSCTPGTATTPASPTKPPPSTPDRDRSLRGSADHPATLATSCLDGPTMLAAGHLVGPLHDPTTVVEVEIHVDDGSGPSVEDLAASVVAAVGEDQPATCVLAVVDEFHKASGFASCADLADDLCAQLTRWLFRHRWHGLAH